MDGWMDEWMNGRGLLTFLLKFSNDNSGLQLGRLGGQGRKRKSGGMYDLRFGILFFVLGPQFRERGLMNAFLLALLACFASQCYKSYAKSFREFQGLLLRVLFPL
jgi:hypothetical protein